MASTTRNRAKILTAGLSMRMEPADRELFNAAARITGRSVGQTLIVCARPTAEKIVAKATGQCQCFAQTNGAQDTPGERALDL